MPGSRLEEFFATCLAGSGRGNIERMTSSVTREMMLKSLFFPPQEQIFLLLASSNMALQLKHTHTHTHTHTSEAVTLISSICDFSFQLCFLLLQFLLPDEGKYHVEALQTYF